MKELCKTCGKCRFYGVETKGKCGNKNSKHYKEFQFSNVVWRCPDFKGELITCDFGRSQLGNGRECSNCNYSKRTMDYECFCELYNRGMKPEDGCNYYSKKVEKKKEFKKICTLSFDKAIEVIQDSPYVYYKHGIWNPYEKVSTLQAIESIKKSGYGADVEYEIIEGRYYVSVPCDSDMF